MVTAAMAAYRVHTSNMPSPFIEERTMSSITRCSIAPLLLILGFFLGQGLSAGSTKQDDNEKVLAAALVRANDAAVTTGDWGHWKRYFRGDTHGSHDLVVLGVTLKTGQAPHPPHKHAEEELMILATGSGVWQLGDNELPAKAGDVLYTAPWTTHGIKNSGDEPLLYYMVKWNGKTVPGSRSEVRDK
jgi:mannose-6-phosphate isomerase-like protein (cupin superfamily)